MTHTPDRPTLLWFRDDLRTSDHEALSAARRDGEVIAIWIREERDEAGLGPRPLGGAARWWADRSLRVLEAELRELGIPLLFARGRAGTIIPALASALGAGAVRWSRRYAPRSRRLDSEIKSELSARGIDAHSHTGALLVEPWNVTPTGGERYKVFTPFFNAARDLPIGPDLPSPPVQTLSDDTRRLLEALRQPALTSVDGLGLLGEPEEQSPRWWAGTLAKAWIPGCVSARDALLDLAEAVDGYGVDRDFPGRESGTSKLSPRLRFGEVSPRQVYHRVAGDLEIPDEDRLAWLRQVYWREFAWHLAYHFPDIEAKPMRPEYERFPYQPDAELQRAWQRGRTGIALVDAGMRQLWATGWMHNRVRMVTASLLTKNLLQPWTAGEQWFWDTLVDADEATNPVSWQWVAGCGMDASPYFRVFNPDRQAERFDPTGSYVRQWAPEADGEGKSAEAIVDLKESRAEALEAYEFMKNA